MGGRARPRRRSARARRSASAAARPRRRAAWAPRSCRPSAWSSWRRRCASRYNHKK